jgi:hypothetical protein
MAGRAQRILHKIIQARSNVLSDVIWISRAKPRKQFHTMTSVSNRSISEKIMKVRAKFRVQYRCMP